MYNRIKKLCRINGISVSALEKKLGIGNGTIVKWKKSMPRADILIKTAAFFSVPAEYLIFGEKGIKSETRKEKILVLLNSFSDRELEMLETFLKTLIDRREKNESKTEKET